MPQKTEPLTRQLRYLSGARFLGLSLIDLVLRLLCFTNVNLFVANIHLYPSVCSCWSSQHPVTPVQLPRLTAGLPYAEASASPHQFSGL